MLRLPLKKSKHVRNIGYDISNGKLEVTLHSGEVLKYQGVREELVHYLFRSNGKTLALQIIEAYTGQRSRPRRRF